MCDLPSLSFNLVNLFLKHILGGVLREFASLSHHLQDRYYKGCLMKFNTLLLTEYKRVIFMDLSKVFKSFLTKLDLY